MGFCSALRKRKGTKKQIPPEHHKFHSPANHVEKLLSVLVIHYQFLYILINHKDRIYTQAECSWKFVKYEWYQMIRT